MNIKDLNIERTQVNKLLSAANPDATLLYLYLHCGNRLEEAPKALNMTQSRVSCAGALLRQLGLWQQEQRQMIMPGERPAYSEGDVLRAMDTDRDFQSLYGEVQRLLGKTLNTEELKILLGFTRYLGLDPDVICVLISYCKDRARRKGSLRNPSLRTIEKEAYAWAEQGIDTMEEAVAFIRNQNLRRTRLSQLMQTLQIRGRQLTAGEEKYAKQWLDWGFDAEAIALAYERTCLNTGGLNWAYMNKILSRWQEAGLMSAQQIRTGDTKPAPKGATGQLGQAELDAIKKLLQEG